MSDAPDAGEGAAGGGTPSPGPRRWRELGLTLAAAVLAFVTGLFVFNSLVMPRLIHREGQVRVPDLTNLTEEQAARELSRVGLPMSRAGERFDPTVARGRVMQQDPPAGTPVRGRRRVSVFVSLGEEYSTVPSLAGESRRSAELLLERAGLRIGGVTRAPSEVMAEGLVVATDPPVESVLPNNREVSLLLSSGPGDEVFVMPDLTGRDLGNMRRQFEARGFEVLTPPEGPATGPIVSQAPQAGTRLVRGQRVAMQTAGRVIR